MQVHLVPTLHLLHGHKTSPAEGIYDSPYFSGVSAFSQIKEALRRLPSASIEFHISLVQNNPYAKLAYLGVAYSDSLQNHEKR